VCVCGGGGGLGGRNCFVPWREPGFAGDIAQATVQRGRERGGEARAVLYPGAHLGFQVTSLKPLSKGFGGGGGRQWLLCTLAGT
jgi:hypothetical protein